MCGCLSLRQLLITIAYASNTTRDVLPPTCLRPRQDALDHFPACHSLRVRGTSFLARQKELADFDLYSLLHHPTVLSCSGVELDGFKRPDIDLVPVDGAQWAQLDVRAAQAKRKPDGTYTGKRRFDWVHIHLPAATRLTLRLGGAPAYHGGVAFLTAHSALTELDITTQLVLIEELTAVFEDPIALPRLTRLSLSGPWNREKHPLVRALATTVIEATGRPRPMQGLELDVVVLSVVLSVAALMPQLSRLHISRMGPGWLTQWTATPQLMTAFPLLQDCIVYVASSCDSTTASSDRHPQPATTDMLLFKQSMASRPLQLLDVQICERVEFSMAAMAELARCRQLRELKLQLDDDAVSTDCSSPWLLTWLLLFPPLCHADRLRAEC